jgi:hypothetical protein
MKLKRELFSKEPYGGGILYKYTCNGQDFFLLAEGVRNSRKISVFKGSTADRAEEFITQSTLQGWAKFEEFLAACQEEQQKNQPQNQNPDENPNITPMLAIRNTGGNYVVRFFVQDVQGEQTTLMEFALPSNAIPSPYPQNVFNVDWSGEEIPAIFKCEVLLSPNPDVVYGEDEGSDVFLFIPKSIMSQGGEPQGGSGGGEPEPEGEGEPQGGSGGEGEGEPQGGSGGEGEGEGEPTGGEPEGGSGGDGEPTDGEPQGGRRSGSGGEGEPTDGEPTDGEPTEGEPQGGSNNGGGSSGNQRQMNMTINSVVQTIADTTGLPANVVENKFFNAKRGETFLTSSGFENIKNALNLPADTTPRQLAEQIINLK